MSSKSFEDRMRQRLERAKIQPRTEIWGELEARIPQRKRRWPWWGWFLEGGTILMLAILFLFPISHVEMGKATTTNMQNKANNILEKSISNNSASLREEKKNQQKPIKNDQIRERILSENVGANVVSPNLVEGMNKKKVVNNEIIRRDFIQQDQTKQHIENISRNTNVLNNVRSSKNSISGNNLVILNSIQTFSTEIPFSETLFDPPNPKNISHKRSRFAFNVSTQLSAQPGPFNFLEFALNDEATIAGIPPRNDTIFSLNQPQKYAHLSTSIEYFLHPRWSIQTGIGVLISEGGLLEQYIYPQGVIQDTAQALSGGNDIGFNATIDQAIESTERTFRSRQLSIPLYINHYLYKGRSAINFSIGAIYSTRLTKSSEPQLIPNRLRISNAPIVNISPVPDFSLTQRRKQLHLSSRLLYQYHLSNSIGLYGGPSIRYSLKPEFESSLIERPQHWNAGIEIGVKWFIGR